jgi:YD repeat-containing protein
MHTRDHCFHVYDPNNNVNNPKTGKGIKISYKDAHDRIVAVQEHQHGQFITTKYAYDILGQIITVTDARNNTTKRFWGRCCYLIYFLTTSDFPV